MGAKTEDDFIRVPRKAVLKRVTIAPWASEDLYDIRGVTVELDEEDWWEYDLRFYIHEEDNGKYIIHSIHEKDGPHKGSSEWSYMGSCGFDHMVGYSNIHDTLDECIETIDEIVRYNEDIWSTYIGDNDIDMFRRVVKKAEGAKEEAKRMWSSVN